MAWVTRCRWPRRRVGGDLGEVEALGLEPGGPLARRQLVAAAGERRPRAAARASLSAWPGRAPLVGVERRRASP